jgi:hypothetical protein
MTLHYEESGHDPTRGVVCECGAKFTGGTSGTYHYHRYVNIYGGGPHHEAVYRNTNTNTGFVLKKS